MTFFLDFSAIFLPFLAALVVGLGGSRLGDKKANYIACGALSLAALLSAWIFYDVAILGHLRTHHLMTWIKTGTLSAGWALRFDVLSSVMVLVVNIISAAVHFYSIGYMHEDKAVPRFMAYMSLFTFFMLMLVTADNLLQLFFGWEGVGLSSYLLIGFWSERPKACAAAIKAFLVNRVGDAGFLLGLFGCYQLFGTLDLDVIFKAAPEMAEASYQLAGADFHALSVIALLLFIGAMGKSAQIGLHVWLPDAMEGPTPVSALIHAATMVTAGVFLVARMSPLFELAPDVLEIVVLVGAVTAVFAASIAMTQYDIKRVIAYSTMSQLGYMFMAAGVSAYGASIFHLATHAFFKALLFLCAGNVIHNLAGEQDMRRMGNLWRKMPYTYGLMWIGTLALTGIGVPELFGFSGFYSKDMILENALARGTDVGKLAYGFGVLAAFMTAFYMGRLIILTFHGDQAEGSKELEVAHQSAHAAHGIFLWPLAPLGLGAVIVGALCQDIVSDLSFWQGSLFVREATQALLAEAHPGELSELMPLLMAVSGLVLSFWFYISRPDMHQKIVKKLGPVHKVAANQFYFDEIYDALFVKPAKKIGKGLHVRAGFFDDLYDLIFVQIIKKIGRLLWQKGDEALIDRFGPDGVAAAAQKISRGVQQFQTGFMPHYALVMISCLAVFIGWAILKG